MAVTNDSSNAADATGAVKHYIQRGWQLTFFPYGTKIPTEAGWNTPRELVTTESRALAKLSGGPINFGVCHQPSGTCSLDIDDEAWTRFIFDELGIDYDEILGAGMRIKSKSNRDKAIFRAPADLALHKVNWPKKHQTKPNDVFTVFELRAGPNQDVLPPSKHPDGHHYTWDEGRAPWDFDEIPYLPAQLEALWRNFKDFEQEIKALCPWKTPWDAKISPKPLQRSVSSEHNDIIGKFNRAHSCGELLEQYGYQRKAERRYLAPSSSTNIPGVVLLKGDGDRCYSHHGSDVLADGHSHDAFDVMVICEFGGNVNEAVKHAAKLLGEDVIPSAFVPTVSFDINALLERQANRAAEKVAENVSSLVKAEVRHQAHSVESHIDVDLPEIPDKFKDLTSSVGGILGKIQSWMLATAPVPSPSTAMAGAIACVASVLGRKVRSPSGIRTNLQIIATAGTGVGKDHPRQCNKAIFMAAEIKKMLGGEEIASAQGLMASMAVYANRLFQLDEFGLMLQALTNPKAGIHLTAIMSSFMKLYSSATTILTGAEKADQKTHARVDIEYPCAVVFGTTTEDELFPAMTSQQVINGYANRMLFVFGKEKRRKRQFNSGITNVPDEIIEWIKAVREYQIGIEGLTPANPVKVDFLYDADRVMSDFEDWLLIEMDKSEIHANLYVRAWEMAAKVCMIVAMSKMPAADLRGQKRCCVTEADAAWAVAFVKFFVDGLRVVVQTRVADSEFDALVKEVSRVIANGGLLGRTESELSIHSRHFRKQEPMMRDKIFAVLQRDHIAEIVQMHSTGGRGKKRMAWVLTKTIQDAHVLDYNPHG